jgi:hypothetical protein
MRDNYLINFFLFILYDIYGTLCHKAAELRTHHINPTPDDFVVSESGLAAEPKPV